MYHKSDYKSQKSTFYKL